jgi:Ca2+/Na+ antiporter
MLSHRRRSPSALFEQRFEAEGDGYLFRTGRKGLPIRVSSSERNDFVVEFRYSYRMISCLMFSCLLVAVAVMAAVYFPRDQDIPERVMQVTVWLLIGGYLALYLWLWYAPNRALSSRSASGPPLTRAERKGRAIDLLSWMQLLALVPVGALLLADAAIEERLALKIAKGLIGLLLVGSSVGAAVMKFQRRNALRPKP